MFASHYVIGVSKQSSNWAILVVWRMGEELSSIVPRPYVSGVYFLRLSTPQSTTTRKIIIQ
ncbi:T9SS type A sorting domain-containing protein [Lewinella lacunae]|uniref:T9SS type A sorting domain-containing protein n=1 Tax=Neolewinella lacunae TaxID=1517758 RepID=A0A923PMH8_9BACT|nr:T9SS type A sorting domain-containing protein [Neolewinella lacunae]